ncbi:MAG: peptidylprolyl isomerase [Nannocystaceae bacterium]|nr:peptidylprolyl isomerase [Nannocystaceae bacterium]
MTTCASRTAWRVWFGILLAALVSLAGTACTRSPARYGGVVSNKALLDPESAAQTAPETYRVKFETTQGTVVIEVHREWAPRGADRFYNLVKLGYFEDIAFFRAIDSFMVQFGIHGTPAVARAWKDSPIVDDPRIEANARGTISFANSGPDTRTTQVFVNYRDHRELDAMGFTPFGEVVEGMDVLDALYTGYGEGGPQSTGPDQAKIERRGNAYLRKEFPKLDWLIKARVLPASVMPEGH